MPIIFVFFDFFSSKRLRDEIKLVSLQRNSKQRSPMKLLDSNGNVILEREKTKKNKTKTHNPLKKVYIKKTTHPRLITKEVFLQSILNDLGNDNF